MVIEFKKDLRKKWCMILESSRHSLSTLCLYESRALNIIIILYINIVKWQVLRRWRHTLRKSGEELPFRYQQITKLIEIGLLCQEEDPCKRPFINEIINGMNKLENMEREISNLSKSTVGQVISCAPHNFCSRSNTSLYTIVGVFMWISYFFPSIHTFVCVG
jgi:hypothetical protein